ncbi:ABC transporter permease [Rhodococcus sp. 14-2470-1b]|uniref:ABC transporter permease n=1 Tax=Rhodococcus sp. 14-2470-1b TaxID=2023149 RepID=UPI000B9C1C29|nr:ABC transporter permease [Rhodococcus sp. 14-2470-1b]OZF54742.1 ABC transporter permease [Rhodococcus sp. 14-2470-1b]
MSGIFQLVRLFARRDRVAMPLWVLAIGLVPLLYAVSFEGLYPTVADRQAFYEATAQTPAELALVGPIFGADLGALVTWRSGILLTLVPLAALLTVIRHTRAEEDAGRTELVGSTAVGRRDGLCAAMALAATGVLMTAVIAATALAASGFAVGGSVAFGLSIAAVGVVFVGVAAVAAQVGFNARAARGYAITVLAAAFVLRAVGDAGASGTSGSSGTLSWLSPIGWSSQLRPFADERWWVVVLPAVAATVAVGLAFTLASRRDLGAGLVAVRDGKPTSSLQGVFGLAWRAQRGSLLAWTVGLGVIAAVLGSAADSVQGQLGGSAAIGDALSKFGGSSLVDSFLATALSILGIGAAAMSVSSVLQAHGDEESSIAEIVLAGSVGRTRWLVSTVVFALGGPAVAMTVVGFAAGLPYGMSVGDVGSVLPGVLAGAMSQLPAVWILTASGIVLFGFVPRFSVATWGLLAAFVMLGQVGTVLGLPQMVLDLSPFTHLPHLPGGTVSVTPLVWLVVVSMVGLVTGIVAFEHRDLRS